MVMVVWGILFDLKYASILILSIATNNIFILKSLKEESSTTNRTAKFKFLKLSNGMKILSGNVSQNVREFKGVSCLAGSAEKIEIHFAPLKPSTLNTGCLMGADLKLCL